MDCAAAIVVTDAIAGLIVHVGMVAVPISVALVLIGGATTLRSGRQYRDRPGP